MESSRSNPENCHFVLVLVFAFLQLCLWILAGSYHKDTQPEFPFPWVGKDKCQKNDKFSEMCVLLGIETRILASEKC